MPYISACLVLLAVVSVFRDPFGRETNRRSVRLERRTYVLAGHPRDFRQRVGTLVTQWCHGAALAIRA